MRTHTGSRAGAMLLLSILTTSVAAANELRPVRLQLKWWHQFQFAGYYAAIEQGFFAAEGLDVTVVEGSGTRAPLVELKAGRADFAVADADGLLERMKGTPLVVVSAVFQHSPYVLLSLKERGLTVPSQLIGKRVMDDDHQGGAQVRAMLLHEGIDPAAITFLRHSWNLDDLIEGRVDAISAYRSVEPLALEARGHRPQLLDAREYGVDFYGDALFTMQALAERDPELVKAFVRASRRGWEWAFAHVDEQAKAILTRPGVKERGVTLEQLRAEAESMRPLVLPDVVEIGHMNPGRWDHIAATYIELGIAPKDADWAGFVFDPDAANERRREWTWRLLLGLGAVAVVAAVWTLQLRRVVRQRTEALERAVAQRLEAERALHAREAELIQSQKLEAIGLLAGGVAHDFNNLLTVVSSDVELLQRKVGAPEELLAEIAEATRKGTSLSRQLLAFARRNRLERTAFDLGALVDELGAMLRRLVSAPVELVLERGAEPLPVEADRSMVEQVVVNLVLNARDAMPTGGRVVLRSRREHDQAVLEVQDEGVGMSPEVAARIFEPFFTTKEPGKGTGLGLSIAHSVAQQHGGSLTVRTAPRAGTTFRFALPCATSATFDAAPATTAPTRRGHGELVLVVEDEPAVRRAMVRALTHAGWQTREAEHGAGALAAFDDAVRLVVSDLRMPGMTGIELLQALRARRPGLPAVLVSGFSEDLHRGGASPELPADVSFLQKPFSADALCTAARAALDARPRSAEV
ncbi:MAG: ABC transporter substrate-binding protein [Myxococcota bacterium]